MQELSPWTCPANYSKWENIQEQLIIKQAEKGQTRPPSPQAVYQLWPLLLLRPPSKAGAKYWQIGGGPWLLSIMPWKNSARP